MPKLVEHLSAQLIENPMRLQHQLTGQVLDQVERHPAAPRTPFPKLPARGLNTMTLYRYARFSVREPEDKNLDLQVDTLARAGCSLDNIRAEEASGASCNCWTWY